MGRTPHLGNHCPTRSTHTTMRQQIKEAYTPGELQHTLSQHKLGKVEGPDGIALDLLKHMSTKMSSVQLTILKSSWLPSWCQQSWHLAFMAHFRKKAKDPADIESYRCIALTLTIGKVLKRPTANRLSWRLEVHSTFSH